MGAGGPILMPYPNGGLRIWRIQMNIYTKEIARILVIDIEHAKKIQDYIDTEIYLDYSECTGKDLREAAIEAYSIIG